MFASRRFNSGPPTGLTSSYRGYINVSENVIAGVIIDPLFSLDTMVKTEGTVAFSRRTTVSLDGKLRVRAQYTVVVFIRRRGARANVFKDRGTLNF